MALDLDEDGVGFGAGPRRPDDLWARVRRCPGECEERGGEIFAGVEGTPLSEPLLIRHGGSIGSRHRLRTHHSDLIVPVRVNDSWMSGTLVESNVYRTGC